MDATDVLRTLLVLDIVGSAVLAVIYLSRRPLSAYAFFAWGLLAVLLPVIGPFVVIAARPGTRRPSSGTPLIRWVKQ